MGACGSASDGIESPKKQTIPAEPKYKKPQKCRLVLPAQLHAKMQVQMANGKITNYITQLAGAGLDHAYTNLPIADNLDDKHYYLDNQFGNARKDIGDAIAEEVVWRRPGEFLKGRYSIFEGQIEPLDIEQGRLGNCYFMSALAGISEYPFIIKRIFETTQQSSYGAYGIWLFIDGLWKCVIVDDRIPVHGNAPLFARSAQNQLWVMLIQKAYAKVFGSYSAIESGLTGIAMNAITGAPFEYICKDSSNKINVESAWQFISSHTAKNHILTGSTQNNDRNNDSTGLVSTHAYTILDCQQVYVSTKKGKVKQRILKLSNPWGRYQWKGRWSESSDVWTAELKQQLKMQKQDDGIFWINLEDFITNFGQICVCKFNKNYINSSLPLRFPATTNDYKCVFLSTGHPTQGYITLYQRDARFFLATEYQYSLARVIILQVDKVTKNLSRYVGDIIDCDRDASFQVKLDAGDYYIIVEMDWKGDFTRDVVLNFYGQQPVNLVEDANPPDMQRLFNEIVVLHETHTQNERIYQYEKDTNIRRVTGSLAGYVYYHYTNKSVDSNYLCESVVLKEKKFIDVDGEQSPNQFLVKVYPDEERFVRLKVEKEGNSYYSFSTKIQFYIVEKYSLEKLRELADQKPTKVKKREIQSKQIDVVVKSYNYSGGIAILYQNKMDKYAYVEELSLEIQNLELENEVLQRNRKLEIELEPGTEKLLSFLVSSPGKQVVFKTKVTFYLNSPEFKF